MSNLFPCAEWAEKLACKPADLSPEERAALQAHVATCPGCAATYDDYQMLMARLRALPRPAARALPLLASEIVTVQDDQAEANGRYDGAGGKLLTLPGVGGAPPVPLPPARRRSWPQRLSAIAAALLVVVLAGSLVTVLVFHHNQPGTAASPFQLRPGWAVIAEYSGTGSKTFSGLRVELPKLWGYAFTCVGSGGLEIGITGGDAANSYDGTIVMDGCSSLPASNASPATMSFDGAAYPLYTIKISVNAKTRWFFQIAQAIKQPTLTLGPEWGNGTGFAGEGNSNVHGLDSAIPTPYKTWGLIFICFGTGSGSVQLTPAVGKITMPACDGQPHLVKVQYPSATVIQGVDVIVRGGMLWDISIVGCANEQKCGVS